MGYLLNIAADRIGALSFGYGKTPPAPERSFNQTEDLEKIIAAANKLERDGRLTKAEKLLLMVGPSAGGLIEELYSMVSFQTLTITPEIMGLFIMATAIDSLRSMI